MAETSESEDHERIFLAPLDEPEDIHQGRMWCEDDGNWDSPGVEFIRLDLHKQALASAEARGRVKGLEEAAKIAEGAAERLKLEYVKPVNDDYAFGARFAAAALRAAKEGE